MRPSLYEFAGGAPALRALASAHHARCLADPELNHPFANGVHPEHVQRLADYWAEVLGGPAAPTPPHSAMLTVHAGQGADAEFGDRFTRCFVGAVDDAGLPEDADFRAALGAYMEWAVAEVVRYSPPGSRVPPGLPTPHWSWDGLQAG
jgi:hemoglobin